METLSPGEFEADSHLMADFWFEISCSLSPVVGCEYGCSTHVVLGNFRQLLPFLNILEKRFGTPSLISVYSRLQITTHGKTVSTHRNYGHDRGCVLLQDGREILCPDEKFPDTEKGIKRPCLPAHQAACRHPGRSLPDCFTGLQIDLQRQKTTWTVPGNDR